MKKFLIVAVLTLLVSCTQKIIVTRVEVNQDKFQKNYNTCLMLLSKQDIKDLISDANQSEQINEVDDNYAKEFIFSAIIDSLEKQEEAKGDTKNKKVLALLNSVPDVEIGNVSKGGNNNSKSKKNKKSNKNKTKKRKGKSSSSRKLKFAKVKKV